MNNSNKTLTYKNDFSGIRLKTIAKTVGLYLGILVYWMYLASIYLSFGRKLMIPMISLMWLGGAVTVFFIKEQRENTLKETKWWILGVLGILTIFKIINYFLNTSNDHMLTTPGELAMTQWLQNMLYVLTIILPLSFLIWCATKFRIFHGKNTKRQAFDRIKNMR